MDKKCANCDADIPDGAKFCMECGDAVDSPSPAIASAPAQENHSPAAQTSRMRDWFIVHRKRAVIAAVALFVLLAALLVLFPPTPAVVSGEWDAKADAPRDGAAHIMFSESIDTLLLKSNGHGYAKNDSELYGTHIQYEISGRKITFYSDDNQREEGTIWGNTIWAFNRRFVKDKD